MAKRTYRSVPIQEVRVDALAASLGASQRAIVAIDVAKRKMVFGFASASGETLKLVRFEHPTQTRAFLELVDALVSLGVQLDIVMEPTGSYGDALRYQLHSRGLPIFFVDPRRCRDASLVFDGVPSQHDAKSCTILAELHARRLSKRYQPRSPEEKRARAFVDRHRMLSRPLRQLEGVLEALIAAHWPELDAFDHGKWLLELLVEYPDAAAVARDEAAVRELLHRVTRGRMRQERIDEILTSARTSVGVPMDQSDRTVLETAVRSMRSLRADIEALEDEASVFAQQASAGVTQLAKTLGTMTSLALLGDVGDPKNYSKPAALQKAVGLNLRERSSGEHVGKLQITKRGSSRARHYLFFAALRFIQRDAIVRAWFDKRCGDGSKLRAVVAVMRKLVLALPHVARGQPFDAHKLFDVRRLDLGSDVPSGALTPS